MKAFQFRKGQGLQGDPFFQGVGHQFPDHPMGRTEIQAFLYQVIGHIGSQQIAILSGPAHDLPFEADLGPKSVKDAGAGRNRVYCIEQGLFVFLQVFVVG